MLKRLGALCVAGMATLGAMGSSALAHPGGGYGAISTVHNSYCDPASRDRLTAPDEFPHNVVKVLRTTNKAQTNSYVPVVFTFKNNNPFNVIRFMRGPVQLEEGTIYTFVHPDGDKGKVLFIVPEYQVEWLQTICKQLDVPGLTSSEGTMRVYRQLKNRRASETDPDFLATAASFSTGTGSALIADPATNALYYFDAPSGAKTLDAMLDGDLDKPTAMVQMMVKIYEVDAYNDAQIGLDYLAWKNGPGSQLFSGGGFKEYGSFQHAYNIPGDIDPSDAPLGTGALPRSHYAASGHHYTYNYTVSSAFFDFLAVKGKARVMNEAKIAALNTWPATLSSTDQVLFYPVGSYDTGENNVEDPAAIGTLPKPGDRTLTQTVNTDTDESGELTAKEVGVTLSVTPTIGTEHIVFGIDVDWSDLVGFDGMGLPLINSRDMSTTARMDPGDEIVLGGMKRTKQVKSTKKMPILGSIPILGWLFGGEGGTNEQSEVIVAIAPTAVMDYKVAYNVAEKDQKIIDAATSGKVDEINTGTGFGFNMIGLDPSYGTTANEMSE